MNAALQNTGHSVVAERQEAMGNGTRGPAARVTQSLQDPPKREDFTVGPDGLAVRKKRGGIMFK